MTSRDAPGLGRSASGVPWPRHPTCGYPHRPVRGQALASWYRPQRCEAARTLWHSALSRSRTGMWVPSTIHNRSTASPGLVVGLMSSSDRSRWMPRPTVAGERPNSASSGIVRFVRGRRPQAAPGPPAEGTTADGHQAHSRPAPGQPSAAVRTVGIRGSVNVSTHNKSALNTTPTPTGETPAPQWSATSFSLAFDLRTAGESLEPDHYGVIGGGSGSEELRESREHVAGPFQ